MTAVVHHRQALALDRSPVKRIPSRWLASWTMWAQLIVLIAISIWIGSESLLDLLKLGWNDSESSQVLLAPLVFIWIGGVRRNRLAECSSSGKWTGVGLIAAGWMLWSLGYKFQIQTFWHLGAIALLAGAVVTVLGGDIFWKFLPAWGALLFLIPIPGHVHLYIAVPLEHATAVVTQSLAEVLGFHCNLSGNQLSVNGTDVSIVEACNGLRMVFTLFMACYVFAFTRPFHSLARITVLAASPIVAMACNVIRLVPTVWMFSHVSHGVAERFHDLAGWGMLIVALGLLTSITHLLNWIGMPVYTRRPSSNPAA